MSSSTRCMTAASVRTWAGRRRMALKGSLTSVKRSSETARASRTVKPEKRRESWKERPSPSRARADAVRSVTSTPTELDPPGVGAEETGDDVEERRLAGTVGPDDPDDLPVGGMEGHVVERRVAAEGRATSPGPRARGCPLPLRRRGDGVAPRASRTPSGGRSTTGARGVPPARRRGRRSAPPRSPSRRRGRPPPPPRSSTARRAGWRSPPGASIRWHRAAARRRCGESPSDSSSMRNSLGRVMVAMARASICCWPPERLAARSPRREARVGKAASASSIMSASRSPRRRPCQAAARQVVLHAAGWGRCPRHRAPGRCRGGRSRRAAGG